MSGVASIILAAGSSTRMGFPKALLTLEGCTFLETILLSYRRLSLPIWVVLGEHTDQITAQVDLTGATVLRNPHPEQGQLSSLKLALIHTRQHQAVIVHPVDHPLVRIQTLQKLLRARQSHKGHILIPAHQGQKGHPVVFPTELFQKLLDASLEEGARYVVRRHPESVQLVPVSDPGVLLNIDTPEQYRRMKGRMKDEG